MPIKYLFVYNKNYIQDEWIIMNGSGVTIYHDSNIDGERMLNGSVVDLINNLVTFIFIDRVFKSSIGCYHIFPIVFFGAASSYTRNSARRPYWASGASADRRPRGQ